jgi:hypothetical protein
VRDGNFSVNCEPIERLAEFLRAMADEVDRGNITGAHIDFGERPNGVVISVYAMQPLGWLKPAAPVAA